jgi:ABC-type oligopeptide transport system ATPase subunit
MLRQRFFYMIVGAPGSGKSTLCATMIKQYPGNVIVYKHTANIDDKAFSFLTEKTVSNWRQGAKPGEAVKCKMAGVQKDYKAFLKWIIANYRNGLLVIDDTTIFERDRLTEFMNDLVTMRRHYGIDIILIYHGLTLLPIEQFIFCNKLVIFNTVDNIDYKANKLPQKEALDKAIQQARYNYNSKTGLLKYTPAIVNLY